MKYLYNDNFEKEFKVAESEAEFKTLSYEEKGLCIDTFYSVMFGQCSPLSHSDCDPGSWYDLDLLDDLGYRTMDEQFNLSQAIDADEIKPLTDDDLLKMFNSALNKYRIFNRKNDGYTVQPQTKKELVTIIKDALCVFGNEADLNFIDTSKITDMSHLFSGVIEKYGGYGLEKFNGDISQWNTSNVTNMAFMFSESRNFNKPLNNWDVSNVTEMKGMFSDAWQFNQPLNNLDVSNVKNMDYMFSNTIFNQPLNNWNTSNVVSMYSMFRFSDFNQPINDWDVSNVTNMELMFADTKFFNQPLDKWDTKNLYTAIRMFEEALNFNQNLNSWNLDKCDYLGFMLNGAKNFDSKIPFFESSVYPTFSDKCKKLGLSEKYIKKHQHDSKDQVEKKNATRASKLSY